MAASDVKPAIVYDITGFNQSKVVEKLEDIVNQDGYQNKEFVFYLGISKVDQTLEFRKLFKLEPKPKTHKPGKGVTSVLQGREFTKRSYNQCLVKELKEKYGDNTSLFAKHLELLFKNNTNMASYPFVTSEVYILLLFEIARQRVKDSKTLTAKRKQLDKLKIDEAITNLITLKKAKACTFDDVFLKGKKFHCFSGEPKEREDAIDNIEKEAQELEQDLRRLKLSETKASTVKKAPKKTP